MIMFLILFDSGQVCFCDANGLLRFDGQTIAVRLFRNHVRLNALATVAVEDDTRQQEEHILVIHTARTTNEAMNLLD
jgi:hypothetical protein